MGDLTASFRHYIKQMVGGDWLCSCGLRTAVPAEVIGHIKAARRWRYLGAEVHYGEKYHMWENDLSGRRYAWHAPAYERVMTR